MRTSSYFVALSLLALPVAACGDDTKAAVDAPSGVKDAPKTNPDAGPAPVDFMSNEGGEVRFEYLKFPPGATPTDRTRATAFFFKGTPVFHQFPAVPGCTRYTQNPPTLWPLAQDPARQYLDVGHVTLTASAGAGYPVAANFTMYPANGCDTTPSSTGRIPLATGGCGDPTGASKPLPLDIPTGAMGKCSVTTATACFADSACPSGETCTLPKDFLDRQYNGPYKYSGTTFNNYGNVFSQDHTAYNVSLSGSSEWPAQSFDKAMYMPDYFGITQPDETVSPVPLVADQDMTMKFSEPTNEANLPAGAQATTLVAFTNGNPPVLLCVVDNISGTLTISKDDINFVRQTVPGGSRLLRQNVVHQLRELTDGTTHQNRRIDFIGVWCWNYPFSVPTN